MPELGEFDLIRRFFERADGPHRALLGIGDDCALLAAPQEGALAVSTDMLVEGRHFFPDMDPAALGHKALAVNLSDLAAMGARPIGFTLALALPDANASWLAGFSAGLLALADAHACELIGGDTTRGPLTISITVFGEVPPALALRRDGARPDDDIWVSGSLGGAAWAVAERLERLPIGQHALPQVPAPVDATRRDAAWQRLERPDPRVALGLALRGVASAAIDLSDGLVGDLGHVLSRSGAALQRLQTIERVASPLSLGATLDWSATPCHPVLQGLPIERQRSLALAGGDDYELLFCAPQACHATIDAIGVRLGLALTRIGRIDPQPGVRLLDDNHQPIAFNVRSFDHFR